MLFKNSMKINANLLSQLFTFEKTAHCTSFTQAAKLLNVTTGAVSQQIRALGSTLGFLLFERHSRGISITGSGVLLRDAVSSGMAVVESTLVELTRDSEQNSEIHLKLTPSFAYKWLVPRLESFYKQHPHITITTYAESGLVNYQEHNYDLAIDYQKTSFENPNALLLLAEQLLPVMSPAYLQQLQWPEDVSDTTEAHWQQANLLHDAMVWPNADKTAEWQAWFAKNQLTMTELSHYFFNRTDMSMAAAEAGVGIALARMALITDELTSKRLVSPFTPISADAGYYLIEHKSSTATQCFKAWLLTQLQA